MSVLALVMADVVDFLVINDQIGVKFPLHILELLYIHTALYNYISLLYHSIISLPNLLWSFNNKILRTNQLICVLLSNITNSKITHYQCEWNSSPHVSHNPGVFWHDNIHSCLNVVRVSCLQGCPLVVVHKFLVWFPCKFIHIDWLSHVRCNV